MYSNDNIIAIPPGETIKEEIEFTGLSIKNLAKELDISIIDANKLLDGEIELTENLAEKLENVLGISKQFWINLEANYRVKLKELI